VEEDGVPAEIPSTHNLPKRQKLFLIILCIVMTLYGALTLSFAIYIWDRGEIANGVTLEIPLGQLHLEEARSKLAQMSEEIDNRPVHFTSEGKNLSISLGELGFSSTYEVPLQQAYLIGREGTFFKKAISKYKASWGVTFKPVDQWNDVILVEALNKQLSTLNIPALIATVKKLAPDQTVGPRTVETGYQTAIIIEGDQFVPGLGGGICQVSSTLYNAVRLASLSVTERSHHSLAVTYVPPGLDATVVYPTLDFKFKNDSDGYLLIRSLVNGSTVSISIYGKRKK